MSIRKELLESKKHERCYFATSRSILLEILASGVILPKSPSVEHKYIDSRDDYFSLVPIWKNHIPEKYKDTDFLNDIPVFLEIDTRFIDQLNIRDEQIIDLPRGYFLSECLPLYYVSKFIFLSRKDKEDFLLRMFGDIVIDKDLVVIDADLQFIDSVKLDEELFSNKAVYTSMPDKVGGSILALRNYAAMDLGSIKITRSLFNVMFGLLNGHDDADQLSVFQKNIGLDISDKKSLEADKYLLGRSISYLSNINYADGIDESKFINYLYEGSSGLGEAERRIVDKWYSYTKKVINYEIEASSLGDKGSIIQRGLLLFILRPKLERLLNVKKSNLKPGGRVTLVALFLAGLFSGYTRMNEKMKGDYDYFIKFTKMLWGAGYQNTQEVGNCNLNIIKKGVLEAEATIYQGKILLGKWVIEPNASLARVFYQSKESGYDLDYNIENNELIYEHVFDGSRKQKVYILLGKPNRKGDEVVRFISPCMYVPSIKSRLLNRAKLLDFMMRNDDAGMYCRFAYSTSRKAIVVEVDQILKTMDDIEFVSHIEYVANIADDYEKEVLKQDDF